MAAEATPITSASKTKNKNPTKAEEKLLEELQKKHGPDISAIERRKSSALKLVRSAFRAIEAIVTKTGTDAENAAEMALENLEDARAKLDSIEKLINKVKDAS